MTRSVNSVTSDPSLTAEGLEPNYYSNTNKRQQKLNINLWEGLSVGAFMINAVSCYGYSAAVNNGKMKTNFFSSLSTACFYQWERTGLNT